MWYKTAQFILKNRVILLIVLVLATVFMAYHASKVQMSYEFAKSIPTDNPKYREYLAFKSKFGEDGTMLVIGVNDPQFYSQDHFSAYREMLQTIKTGQGVEGVLSVATAVNLHKNDSTEKLISEPLFPAGVTDQQAIDSASGIFNNLLFYRGLLYNLNTQAYVAAITVNARILASKERSGVIKHITDAVENYQHKTGVTAHVSGLPLIRTQVADRIKKEMNFFLFGSLALAMITLILFFRSFSATVLSMLVVIIGVVFAVGTMVLMGYKISLLTALIPPLIIVIGIPNCIYFLNKFHMSWEEQQPATDGAGNPIDRKTAALLQMVSRMGVVTLFCNIAAAVGFYVFAFTSSPVLREFGVVAGINIMVLFLISLIFIPTVLSFLPPPKAQHTKYLRNRLLEKVLVKIEYWVLQKKGLVYGFTALVVVVSLIGMTRLKSVGFIVDDLPKQDKIYVDLKWFETNVGGVMPLEIVIDTKKKNGITRNLQAIGKIDHLSAYIASRPQFAKPLNLVEGLKFAKQAYYDGDSLSYDVPNEFDMVFLAPYLKGNGGGDSTSQLAKITRTFMDSSRQMARISINMADVGTAVLPKLLDSLQAKADTIFNLHETETAGGGPAKYVNDSAYNILFTGSSVTFLEGSRFIINGLKESILWAFLLIALCMLYLFRSFRILLCSLIPNVVPLVVTAGLMGWMGIPLKPSTVLVFSVALGIAIDVTIRFLVNYKQELPHHHNNILATTTSTIRHTGISIIYTSLVLVAGFVIFVFSRFGGTIWLGWLTSFTLLIATFTNLIFLPVIMLDLLRKKKK